MYRNYDSRNLPLILSFIIISFTLFQNGFAQQKYSTIVNSDGYAFIAENKTISELRDEAVNNAKKEALEQTYTYIRSFTQVENYQVVHDLIQTQSEGAVKIVEKKDYGFTDDNRYHVRIKAEVQYLLPDTDGVKKQIPTEKILGPLNVEIWTEKKAYKSGEKVKLYMQSNKDCYVRVIFEDSEHNILQIFPNQHRQNNYLFGNHLYTIPDPLDNFEFTVASPFGTENITVFASTVQLGESALDIQGDNFYEVKENRDHYALKTRGIKVTEKETAAEFYEQNCTITTQEK